MKNYPFSELENLGSVWKVPGWVFSNFGKVEVWYFQVRFKSKSDSNFKNSFVR